jgi:hypothetical protein
MGMSATYMHPGLAVLGIGSMLAVVLAMVVVFRKGLLAAPPDRSQAAQREPINVYAKARCICEPWLRQSRR